MEELFPEAGIEHRKEIVEALETASGMIDIIINIVDCKSRDIIISNKNDEYIQACEYACREMWSAKDYLKNAIDLAKIGLPKET